ncbi:MAG TPA: CsgG/HfaB family protein [Polyangiaceae bacterium]|jgi:curli biogenesis system outer membrane secretion channel CsgG
MTTKLACAAMITLLLPLAGCGGASAGGQAEAKTAADAPPADEPAPKLHGPKKRIAIVDFDDTTGHNLAEAARDVATESLIKTGAFIVVEREQLAAVLKEQGLGQTGAINPMTAAAAGKVLGLQAILTGKVTDYADENKASTVLMVSRSKRIARARVSLRMTDATTGETWLAESGEGQAEEGGTVVYGQGGGSHDQGLGKKALYIAIHQMTNKILTKADNKPWSSTVAKANVKDGKVYITAGSEIGLPAGSTLSVRHQGDEITDPTTNQVIGHEPGKEVGQLKADSDLNEKVTVCKIATGTDFVPGDVVTLSAPSAVAAATP